MSLSLWPTSLLTCRVPGSRSCVFYLIYFPASMQILADGEQCPVGKWWWG